MSVFQELEADFLLQMYWHDERLELYRLHDDVNETAVVRGNPSYGIDRPAMWVPRGLVFREQTESRPGIERHMVFGSGQVQFDSR